MIRSALDRAIINRYIQTNPANLVDTPKITRDEIQIFTPHEVDLLLSQARSNRFYPVLLLAVTSGMRLGELLGIRWQDIDLNNHEVHVRQTLQSTNKKGIIFEPPKTKNSKRRITIPLQTIAVLTEYEKIWSESRKEYPGKDDLVFVTNKHSPLSPQNFLRRFWNRLQMDVEFALNDYTPKPMSVKKKLETILAECREQTILDECGKPKKWQQFSSKNFHVIRHTYATTLLAANVPITDVSRALGHARVSTA